MDMSNRYNRKIAALSGAVGALALLYAGILIFGSEQARDPLFVWLEASRADQADRIELSGSEGGVTLVRKGGLWFVSRDSREYPAKQSRVQDLLSIVTAKGRAPLRGTEASSHERLGLAEGAASRLAIRSSAAPYPLLDLLIGNTDSTGQEVYLRKSGEAEVRSSEDRISGYVGSRPASWFNLRLFPEADYPNLNAEAVQRLTVEAPASGGGAPEVLTLSRHEGGWTLNSASPADTQQAESYIGAVLMAEGEDFLAEDPARPVQAEGRIRMELGNGQTLDLAVGGLLEPESKRRSAWIEGAPFKYILAEWALSRLFREGSYFGRP
ncbi:MAG: DUF4340 domain-containing protein [Spirochaetaceae bacterium]|jgi:hypothetical protein|nr:DUF4340 domain-containing protein [Spirochaetaceae bacterium]